MLDNVNYRLKLLRKLYDEYGDELIDEITDIVYRNGQGDCYEVECMKYCNTNSCFNAIKKVVIDFVTEIKECG